MCGCKKEQQKENVFADCSRKMVEMGAAQNALNELRESPLIEISYEEIKQRAEDKGIRVTRENAFELADQELCRQIEQLLAQNGLQ